MISGAAWWWSLSEDVSPDYYTVLGVSKTATRSELKKRYNTLALRYHPDKIQGSLRSSPWWLKAFRRATGYESRAARNFVRIAEAYQVLKEDKSREEYDASRRREGASRDDRPSSWHTRISMWQIFLTLTAAIAILEYVLIPSVLGLFKPPEPDSITDRDKILQYDAARQRARARQQANYSRSAASSASLSMDRRRRRTTTTTTSSPSRAH